MLVGPGPDQPGDRRGPGGRRDHGEDPRGPDPGQDRLAGPGAAGGAGLRDRSGQRVSVAAPASAPADSVSTAVRRCSAAAARRDPVWLSRGAPASHARLEPAGRSRRPSRSGAAYTCAQPSSRTVSPARPRRAARPGRQVARPGRARSCGDARPSSSPACPRRAGTRRRGGRCRTRPTPGPAPSSAGSPMESFWVLLACSADHLHRPARRRAPASERPGRRGGWRVERGSAGSGRLPRARWAGRAAPAARPGAGGSPGAGRCCSPSCCPPAAG